MRFALRHISSGLGAVVLSLCGGAMAAQAPLGPSVVVKPAAAKPIRIMSMNECTDLLVLQLVPKARIASVSFLAHDAVKAVEPGLDTGVAVNHGAAEEVLQQKPDLVITGVFGAPNARRLAGQVGARLIEVDQAQSFDQIRRVTRQVGEAVGEPGRAEALIRRMDAELAALKAAAPPRISVVAWSGGGSVPGRGTLTNAIIEAAGAVNIGATSASDHYRRFGLEELLKARPDALLQGQGAWDQPSLQDDESAHRVVRTLYRGRRVAYPEAFYSCGLPQSADAAWALRQALMRLPKRGPVH